GTGCGTPAGRAGLRQGGGGGPAMNDDAVEESLKDVGPELAEPPSQAELVHWMDEKPLSVGPAGMSLSIVGGFALGVAAALLVLAFSDIVDPLVVRRRRRTAG